MTQIPRPSLQHSNHPDLLTEKAGIGGELLQGARRTADEHVVELTRVLARQQIADVVGVNQDYLSRIFHQELGLSPWAYLNRYRILQAKTLLRSTSLPITDVALKVGFDNPAYFSRVFRQSVGCSPRAFQEQPDQR